MGSGGPRAPLGDEVTVGGDHLAGHANEGAVVMEGDGVRPVEHRVPPRVWEGGGGANSGNGGGSHGLGVGKTRSTIFEI